MKNEYDFGKLLREIRLEKKLSQTELAVMLSTSQDTVSLWELNKGSPHLLHLRKIAEIFDISGDYLLGLKDY